VALTVFFLDSLTLLPQNLQLCKQHRGIGTTSGRNVHQLACLTIMVLASLDVKMRLRSSIYLQALTMLTIGPSLREVARQALGDPPKTCRLKHISQICRAASRFLVATLA
jgi:hypothetical protein